jgi:translation initiation factor 3 subunit B
LPVVPREKFEKLEGVIRKIYSQIGLIKDDGLWMPIDPETQKTVGYCFIEFNTPLVILSLLLPSHWYDLAKTFSSFMFIGLQMFLLSNLRQWNI